MILEEYVQQYLVVVEPIAQDALKATLLTIANELRNVRFSETTADEFADKFFDLVKTQYTGEFDSSRSVRAIKSSVAEAYRYFRTADDLSVFDGDDPGIRVRFGGLDRQTQKFFGELDNYYFSKFVDNSDKSIKTFFADQYIAKGGRAVVDLTNEQIEDIRAALGDKLKNVNDVNVERIVRASTVRARNWAHINRMREGKIELMQIIAVLDSRTSEICRFLNGKFIRVSPAAEAVDRMSQLQPGEFAKETYDSPIGKGLRATNNNADEVAKFFKGRIDDDDVLDDSLMAKGVGLAPYHLGCRTRMKSVITT